MSAFDKVIGYEKESKMNSGIALRINTLLFCNHGNSAANTSLGVKKFFKLFSFPFSNDALCKTIRTCKESLIRWMNVIRMYATLCSM